jgi:hypothetical protein
LRHFKAFIQNKLIRLNIFPHYPSSDRQIRYQRYASRLYIFLIFSSIPVITVYTLLETSTQSKTILNPTQSQYEQLQQVYPETLSCSCNLISISYLTFITIQPHYHQLCSSDLVSEQWNTYLKSLLNSETQFIYSDYRYVAVSQFQLLTMMCQQAQETIDDALQVFLQTQFVSPQVISQESFEFQVNSLIEDWKSTTINTFMRTFQLVRATEQGNQLDNTNDNAAYNINSISRTTIMTTLSYSGCNCGLSPSCSVTAGIYDYDQYSGEFTEIYSIPNFFIGCFLLESLLSSTLECFYNISCMLKINSYLSSAQPFNFSALDPSLNSPNETIELIVDQLMVDTWSSNVSFTSYYKTCAPLSCTFQYQDHNNLFIVITTVASVFGGLSLGFQLIILIGLQLIDKIIKNGFSRLTLWHSIKYLFTCNTEHQMIHRLHFILVVTIVYVLYIYSVFSPRIITVEIMKPSLSMYKDLVAQSYDSLECPCTQISIKYESFLNIQPRFHEVCSSDFVSDQWITYVYGTIPPVKQFSPTDFFYSASGQFQLLASFCQLSQETVNNSLSQLGVSDFINTELLSLTLFDDRIQTTINQFQLTIPNLFVNTLSLIRETTGANMLMTVLSTSWIFAIPASINNGWTAHTVPLDYDGCSCALSSKCVTPSRGMLAGCYPLEAILQTTLECLYDQQCIDSTNTFTAMNISSLNSSRFPLNTTIELIVNQLMIEEFISNISYESYFNQCAPLSCTYSYVDNSNLIEGITTLIGLYGGLVIICQLFSIFIVKQILRMRHRVSPITN